MWNSDFQNSVRIHSLSFHKKNTLVLFYFCRCKSKTCSLQKTRKTQKCIKQKTQISHDPINQGLAQCQTREEPQCVLELVKEG